MDESESKQGREMLGKMITEVVGTPIPQHISGWPFPRKPVGPSAHPEKFKVGKAGLKSSMKHGKTSRPSRSKKKGIFAGWD